MGRVSVLIVDDDSSICEALSDVLELKGGYATDTAETAQAALGKAREKSFNVALLDLTLPDMQGVELLRQLKRLHPKMELIVLSGQTSVEKAEEAVREGAFACLVKPSSPSEVMTAIEGALERQQTLLGKG